MKVSKPLELDRSRDEKATVKRVSWRGGGSACSSGAWMSKPSNCTATRSCSSGGNSERAWALGVMVRSLHSTWW